ncbi:MAG: carboxymuconolactone decarboxylase family protein [Alcaligenaceae bacterium]
MKNITKHLTQQLATFFLMTACALPASGQTPPQPGEPKRFPQLTLEQLPPEVKPLAEEIIKISTSGIGGPYNIMLRSPVFAERMKHLLDYLRFNTSVSRRLNEFAILIHGNLWKSQVEWSAHYPMALKAGLSKEVADDLKNGIRPRNMQPDEAVVYDLFMEMNATHEVSDATFARAKEILGEQQLVDLVAVSGTYVTVAMLLALGKVMPPEGKPLPYPPAK